MKQHFARKTALFALVILTIVCTVFFACACEKEAKVTVDFSVEGDLVAGSTLSFDVIISGKESAVAALNEAECLFEIVSGEGVASIADSRLVLSDEAHKGDTFSVRLTVKGISIVKDFVIALDKPIPVESVTLLCADSAEAGETISLSAVILPEGIDVLPIYTVLSGNATVEGNLLKISEDADAGEVVVVARAAGVSSEEKVITITTVQTQGVFLTFSRNRALPGESLRFIATKEPASSSYPIELSLEDADGVAELDLLHSTLLIREDAEKGSEVTVIARSGREEARVTVAVNYPLAEEIHVRSGATVVNPGTDHAINFSLYPETADPSTVNISISEGEDLIEWSAGEDTFRVMDDAREGEEITFLLEVIGAEDVYNTVSYRVGRKVLTSLSISTTDPTEYLRSGSSVTFVATTVPAGVEQEIRYRATEGADLVQINGNVVTVKDRADIGRVKVVAESEDGTISNECEFTVSGRYSRRVYSSWSTVSFATIGENADIWMVLPSLRETGGLTVLVPSDVKDLVIEGCYDGSDETAYKNLYFYFRNASQRKVTLWNFGTIATDGLGGTVLDFGSEGETEILLVGQNLVRADTPYYINNSGEIVDGLWKNDYSSGSMQEFTRRSGKPGYRGTTGGTAISGFALTFLGSGSLTAVAGNGINGTSGGNGADAVPDGSLVYVTGNGGAGGNGGDSGAAIYAEYATFLSGFVTALPGNAGLGGKGGSAGSLEAVIGYNATKMMGDAGTDGENGTPYPAVKATHITGTHYTSSVGVVKGENTYCSDTLAEFANRLSKHYGVTILYGNQLVNEHSRDYTMTTQSNATEIMRQMNFLMYSMSVMPKNCWQEILYRNRLKAVGNGGAATASIKIYLCNTIKSSGSTILGLTDPSNNIWFATFNTDLRGVFYSGYYNIMIHEFLHVFHYNFTSDKRSDFETALSSKNYGLAYKKNYGSATDRVYGFGSYNETNSCFFTKYSRKTVMEDTSETISIAATFSAPIAPMTVGTRLREKVKFISDTFAKEYETFSAFVVGSMLFCDRRLA